MLFYVMNDQAERREGVKALLRQVHRQARMSDVCDWRQLERMLGRGLPDLLVIDWQSGSMTFDALRDVRHAHAALAIAVLSDSGDAATVGSFVRAGALGVIPRNLEPRLILRALELVLLGGYYVPVAALGPDIGKGISGNGPDGCGLLSRSERADRAAVLADSRGARSARAGLLSPRQQQIMRLVHLGNTNKTIARALDISEGTVKIHLAAIFRLLGATNRAAAVALYNGWQHGAPHALRTDRTVRDAGTEPRPGMRCPIPLRVATGPARFGRDYPLAHGEERSATGLLAAQPERPFAQPRRRLPVAPDFTRDVRQMVKEGKKRVEVPADSLCTETQEKPGQGGASADAIGAADATEDPSDNQWK